MTAEELEQAVLAFVNIELWKGQEPVPAEARLFEDGYLDSLRVMDLIAFVERTTGRRVSDRAIRLSTFRSARSIAAAFHGAAPPQESPELRREYRTTPERFASPIEELRRRGELRETPEGTSLLAGHAAQLFTFFDATFARFARELGADDVAAPPEVAVATLERAGFLGSFPQLVSRAGESRAYSPAACYHRYEAVAGQALASPVVLGVRAACRRNEIEPRPLERATSFTMREVIVLGAREDVERVRRRLLRRIDRFVTSLALDGVIEPATDPFFTDADGAKALAQRAGELKLELRLSLEGNRRVAVASFNRHHDHFGRRFDISIDGAPAHSGCIAFGIERWVLALLTQHGLDERDWPAVVRDGLEFQQRHARTA